MRSVPYFFLHETMPWRNAPTQPCYTNREFRNTHSARAYSNSGHAHFYASDSEFKCSSCLCLRNLKTCSSSFDPNAFMWASKSASVSNSHEQHGHFFISTRVQLPFFLLLDRISDCALVNVNRQSTLCIIFNSLRSDFR